MVSTDRTAERCIGPMANGMPPDTGTATDVLTSDAAALVDTSSTNSGSTSTGSSLLSPVGGLLAVLGLGGS